MVLISARTSSTLLGSTAQANRSNGSVAVGRGFSSSSNWQSPPSSEWEPIRDRNGWHGRSKILGHTVRIIPAQFVKPYLKSNENDALDAEAIAEAVTRPTMRFVDIKSVEQVDVQALHRARDMMVMQRTRMISQMRAFCLEYGVAIRQGAGVFKLDLPRVIAEESNDLSLPIRRLLAELFADLQRIEGRRRDHARDRSARRPGRCSSPAADRAGDRSPWRERLVAGRTRTSVQKGPGSCGLARPCPTPLSTGGKSDAFRDQQARQPSISVAFLSTALDHAFYISIESRSTWRLAQSPAKPDARQ